MIGISTDTRLSSLLQYLQRGDPFADGQAIDPNMFGKEVARVADTKPNLRDGIQDKQELQELMQLLNTTGGEMNGLPRPNFQNLGGMTSADMLAALIDWIQSGGPEANKKISRPAPIGRLSPPTNYHSRPTSWNPSGGGSGGGGSSGGVSGSGGSGGTSGGSGSSAPAGSISTDVKPFNGQKVNPMADQHMRDPGGTDFGEDRGDHAHSGEDFAAPAGTPIHSVADGTIVDMASEAESGGYGNLVKVRHQDGTESWYAHLSSFGDGLKEGDKVGAGTVIGGVGNTGHSFGNHLHFEIRQNGRPVSPKEWLRGAESVA